MIVLHQLRHANQQFCRFVALQSTFTADQTVLQRSILVTTPAATHLSEHAVEDHHVEVIDDGCLPIPQHLLLHHVVKPQHFVRRNAVEIDL